ncbi:MAG: PilZ domain-containing protein [Pseudohongiella sp.]|nr:PilZ domain-containing protein [Pseudohongiella sp.]
MTVSLERRNHPRIDLQGEANILLAGVVRNGTLMNLSPSGLQIECRHQLIEQLNQFKSNAGLFPDFELEFTLPSSDQSGKKIKSTCNVSYCRRQRQDSYHLGLNFVSLDERGEIEVAEYLNKLNEA